MLVVLIKKRVKKKNNGVTLKAILKTEIFLASSSETELD